MLWLISPISVSKKMVIHGKWWTDLHLCSAPQIYLTLIGGSVVSCKLGGRNTQSHIDVCRIRSTSVQCLVCTRTLNMLTTRVRNWTADPLIRGWRPDERMSHSCSNVELKSGHAFLKIVRNWLGMCTTAVRQSITLTYLPQAWLCQKTTRQREITEALNCLLMLFL